MNKIQHKHDMMNYFQLYLHKLKRMMDDLRLNFAPINEAREIYPWMLNFVNDHYNQEERMEFFYYILASSRQIV